MTTQVHKITILGSGTSTGVPMVACSCAVCRSPHSKNKRLRTSVFIEPASGERILVDTGPDLREQCLGHQITALDFVILTHDHADHLHGIDDLRPFTFPPAPPVRVLSDRPTLKQVYQRFPYLKDPSQGRLGGGKPELHFQEIDPSLKRPHPLGQQDFFFFHNLHGTTKSLGFCHESMAYIVDCHEVSEENLIFLKEAKLDLLLIDCVQDAPHQTHLWYDRALDYILTIAPARAGLIHIGHKLDHFELEKRCSLVSEVEVFPCYDGQILQYRTASSSVF